MGKAKFLSRDYFYQIYVNLLLFTCGGINNIKMFFGIIDCQYDIVGYIKYKRVTFSEFICTKQSLKHTEEFDDFKPDDVVLLTYPKAGTHFTSGVILSIYKEAKMIEGDKEKYTSLLEMVPPHVNMTRLGVLGHIKELKTPRLIKTHVPYDMLPAKVKEGKVKVVHCIRNPKDVACSAFPFLKKMKCILDSTTWKNYVINYMRGEALYGCYFRFLREWYPYRNDSHVLTLHFEDMKKDLEGCVRKVAAHLNVELTQAQIDNVVAANTFESLKEPMNVGIGSFLYRKGKSGGWRDEFSVSQNEMMDEWIKHEMQGMEDLTLRFE